MIKKPNLDTKDTGGQVGQPQYAGATTIIPGGDKPAPMNTRTGLNPGASEANLSKKFKNPAVKQDVPEKGRGQYEDHS
jgi:hypothetical protein